MVIAYLCFAPANEFRSVKISIPYFDKIVHFGMFFIAGVLIKALVVRTPSAFHKVWLPVIFVFYAMLTEIVQYFYIYKREGDVLDWLADIFGLFLGMLVFRYIPKGIQKVLV